MKFAKLLQNDVKKHGHTLESFAKLCNVSYGIIWGWLNGARFPSTENLIYLAIVLCDLNKNTFNHQIRRLTNAIREDLGH